MEETSNKCIENNKIMDGKEKRLLNLIPAKKGEIRNPYGRPKKNIFIPDILNRLTSEEIPEELKNRFINSPSILKEPTILEAIMRLVVNRALKGDSWAIEFVAERTEGKAVIPIEVKPYAPPLQIIVGNDPTESLSISLPQEGLSNKLLKDNNNEQKSDGQEDLGQNIGTQEDVPI